MKKIILILGLLGVVLLLSSFTTKKVEKKQPELPSGVWIVKMHSNEHMQCTRGGASDCPINWFLGQ